MTSAGKISLGVFKWVIIPLGLGFGGYHFIGPQFTKVAPGVSQKVSASLANSPSAAPADGEPAGPKRNYSAPKVEITVSDPSPRRQSSSRRARVSASPVDTTDGIADLPPDEAAAAQDKPKPKRKKKKAAAPAVEPVPDPAAPASGGDEAGSGGAATGGDNQGDGF